MNNICRKRCINFYVNCITFKDALAFAEHIMVSRKQALIVTPNAQHVVLLEEDPVFRAVYSHADLVVPDSVPLCFFARFWGLRLERVTGADLFKPLCERAWRVGVGVMIIGGVDGSEGKALAMLRERFPGMRVDAISPPRGFESDSEITERILQRIETFSPGLILLCVGTPKSEKWLDTNRAKIGPALMIAVGAALDFFVGTKRRAPYWMRSIGMEWFWRFLCEPRRLWKRYLFGNIKLIYIVIKYFINDRVLKRRISGC